MADEKDINNPENVEESQAENEQQDVGVDVASDVEPEAVADEAADEGEKVVNEDDASEDDAEAAMLAMLEDLPDEDGKADLGDIDFPVKEQTASNVEFQHLSEPAGNPDTKNIDMLLDVNLPIAIELGRTKMSISDILELGPGSVVELSKLAGEPVDLLVNQRVVAKGEVVVIDENFGVRITQLLTPEERLKALGEEK